MKISILAIASDAEFVSRLNVRKASIIPKEIRKGHNFSVSAKLGELSDQELVDWVLKKCNESDAVGILIESGFPLKFLRSCPAIFYLDFCLNRAKVNMNNYFGSHLSRWIDNLIFLSKCFNDRKLYKCLILPRNSFDAPRFEILFDLCATQAGRREFKFQLEAHLKSIRERSIPKKKKSGSKHFLKDDNERYFELARENHGQSETTNPPHNSLYLLTATARFGVSIDREIHFNVSEEAGTISGKFVDCHGGRVVVKERSHINMFPNGFIR